MTDTVTEEAAVEAAAKALFEVEWRDCPGGWTWEQADDSDKPYWRTSARAALEAVPSKEEWALAIFVTIVFSGLLIFAAGP